MRKGMMVLGAVVVVTGACADGPTAVPVAGPQMAAFTETINERVPLAEVVVVPCAADGAGETVLLTGELHVVEHVTVTQQGFTEVVHVNPQGVTGTGLTTGDTYQGTGATQDVVTVHAAETTTFISNFRIIGQGPGNNLLVHVVLHATVTPSGNTTTVEHVSIDCK